MNSSSFHFDPKFNMADTQYQLYDWPVQMETETLYLWVMDCLHKMLSFFFNQQTIWLPLWITNNNFLLSKIWKRIFSSINFIIWSFNMLQLSIDSPKINWLISLWSSIKYGHNRVYNSFQLAKFEREKINHLAISNLVGMLY